MYTTRPTPRTGGVVWFITCTGRPSRTWLACVAGTSIRVQSTLLSTIPVIAWPWRT